MATSAYQVKEGDEIEVSVTVGYRLVQNRPYPCGTWAPDPNKGGAYSSGCKCGSCDGKTVVHKGIVEKVIYWADNSIDAEVRCEDGWLRVKHLAPPSGDVCF